MQRPLDLLDDQRRRQLEASRSPDLLDHAVQQRPRVVALAEEPPVERVEPATALPRRDEGQRDQPGVDRRARAELLADRPVAVPVDVGRHHGEEDGHDREQQAASEGVADALPDDEADVEHPVAERGVGERQRDRQEAERGEREGRRGEQRRLGPAPVRQRNRPAGCRTDASAEQQHAEATTLDRIGAAVFHERDDRGGAEIPDPPSPPPAEPVGRQAFGRGPVDDAAEELGGSAATISTAGVQMADPRRRRPQRAPRES